MERDIQSILEQIVEILVREYRPEQIVLFGSYAHGQPDEESDIDLLIVKETARPFYKRLLEIRQIVSETRRGFPFDPIVFTPQEFRERLEHNDRFLREIMTEGQVIYAQSS